MEPNYSDRGGSHIPTGRLIAGGVIIIFGLMMLFNLLGLLPSFRFLINDGLSVFLIAIGIIIGVRSNFRNLGAFVLIFIGGARLVPVFPLGNGIYSNQLFWPLLFVAIGLAIIFRKRNRRYSAFTTPPRDFSRQKTMMPSGDIPAVSNNNAVNIDVSFGGRKEIITSKSFTGGRINVSFAGAEVNLLQADGNIQPMVLDVRVSFGSVELIVPSHWELKNEISPAMGSVEDHRSIHSLPASGAEQRTLLLRGNCTCGSIEIKSY